MTSLTSSLLEGWSRGKQARRSAASVLNPRVHRYRRALRWAAAENYAATGVTLM